MKAWFDKHFNVKEKTPRLVFALLSVAAGLSVPFVLVPIKYRITHRHLFDSRDLSAVFGFVSAVLVSEVLYCVMCGLYVRWRRKHPSSFSVADKRQKRGNS